MDGKYTGSASMINPPRNLSGQPGMPITIKALNDGKVVIDGQSVNHPVRLRENDYFVLEGFNAHHSKSTVVELRRSSRNVLKRVAAWDAADGNTSIFGIHDGTHNLLEDIAGWGIARKIFSSSQGGNHTTIRRAWGRWEGSHVVGPKMTYTLAYNNYYMTCENCIGTWSGERMKETYILLDYHGKPWTGRGAGIYTDYRVNQPYGIFAGDGLNGSKDAHSKLLGSIAYIRRSDSFKPKQVILLTKMDSIHIRNTVVYVEGHPSKRRFALYNLRTGKARNLVASKLAGIGGRESSFHSEWQKDNILEGPSRTSIANVFTSSHGARLCHRYLDGRLTNVPLWPWPMNQRIKDGMIQSGRSAVDVTATVEEMFGAIPSSCKMTDAVTGEK